jgi:hypothetical protein
MSSKYYWETEFDTAKDLMIHTFSDRIKVVTNIKTGEVKTLRDGEVIDRLQDMPISDYEKFLLRVAADADKLKEFSA